MNTEQEQAKAETLETGRLRLTVELNPDEVRQLVNVSRRTASSRWLMAVLVAMPCLTLVDTIHRGWSTPLTVLAVAIMATPLMLVLRHRWRGKIPVLPPDTFELSETGLHRDGPTGSSFVGWSLIRDVSTEKGLRVLLDGAGQPVAVVPDRLLSDRQREWLAEVMASAPAAPAPTTASSGLTTDPERIDVRFRHQFSEYLAASLYYFWRGIGRKVALGLVLVFPFVVALQVVSRPAGDGLGGLIMTSILSFAGAAAIGGGVVVAICWNSYRRESGGGEGIGMSFTASGIAVRTPASTTETTWDQIATIWETRRRYFLLSGTGWWTYLPRTAFASADDEKRFRRLAGARIAGRVPAPPGRP